MRQFLLRLLLVALHAAHAGASEPLTKGRIVVLSGLPGDVESDRAYQSSLVALLEVMDAAEVGNAAVRLLVNDPEHVAVVGKWKDHKIEKGSRERLLEVGQEVGESADPVTVVVWGHGGLIRGESVLHVAGPRVSAADFREFGRTAALGGAEVRWVLFFPGSGAVAVELAAMGQGVFASEASTRFESDPIGLDLVLREWRAVPKATLEKLARRAGPRIADYYETRSLARTEEPAWFAAGAGEPVLVAEAGGEVESMSGLTPRGTSRDAAWFDLERVRGIDYPGADAVVLERSLRYTIGENPAIGAEINETIQILTAEGKRHGDFRVNFSPPQEDLRFLSLEVLATDGSREIFDPEDVLEAKADSGEGYGTSASKMFSLRGVEPRCAAAREVSPDLAAFSVSARVLGAAGAG